MPNHTSNELIITGPDEVIKEMFCSHFQDGVDDEGEGCFNCNSVVPMPADLKITSGGHVRQYAGFIVAEPEIVQDFLNDKLGVLELYTSAAISSQPEIIRYLQFRKADTEKLKADFEEGRKYLSNIMKYGYESWYPWSNNNWGTKWGAYDGDTQHTPGEIIAHFQSAWSPPTPVIKELSELYPEVTIHHKFLDEGYGFGGFISYEDGEQSDEYDAIDVSTFAQEEFGHEPYESEDDE